MFEPSMKPTKAVANTMVNRDRTQSTQFARALDVGNL
jgi:hypothetical protein